MNTTAEGQDTYANGLAGIICPTGVTYPNGRAITSVDEQRDLPVDFPGVRSGFRLGERYFATYFGEHRLISSLARFFCVPILRGFRKVCLME